MREGNPEHHFGISLCRMPSSLVNRLLNKGQWAQTEAEEVPSEHEEELLPSEGEGAQEQAAQGGCGFSGHIQDPPGRGPVQPAVGGPE